MKQGRFPIRPPMKETDRDRPETQRGPFEKRKTEKPIIEKAFGKIGEKARVQTLHFLELQSSRSSRQSG